MSYRNIKSSKPGATWSDVNGIENLPESSPTWRHFPGLPLLLFPLPSVSTCSPLPPPPAPGWARPAGPGGTRTTADRLTHLGFVGEPQHREHGGQRDAHVGHELKHCGTGARVEDEPAPPAAPTPHRAREPPLCGQPEADERGRRWARGQEGKGEGREEEEKGRRDVGSPRSLRLYGCPQSSGIKNKKQRDWA